MEMLFECFNTTKCNVEFGIDNYVYEKEKIQTNANGTETIYEKLTKKRQRRFERENNYS